MRYVEVRRKWRIEGGIKGLITSVLVTSKYVAEKRLATKYPFEKNVVYTRGILAYDLEKCIGCNACVLACPNKALWGVRGEKTQRNRVGLWIAHEPTHCMLCGLCVEACPTGALYHTTVISLVTDKREIKWSPQEFYAFHKLWKKMGWEGEALDYEKIEELIKKEAGER